jgi:hypothetical protein
MTRDDTPEVAAAQALLRVFGGKYEINDTGEEPGQFDVRIVTAEGRSLAVEVTSYGGDDWRRARARIEAERRRGGLDGEGLRQQWWVVVPTRTRIRDLSPRLIELLIYMEGEGKQSATTSDEGDDAILRGISATLRELRVNSVWVWDSSPDDDQPRVLVSQSERRIGTMGALPAALSAVFEKGDNQKKLRRADCDERHLYVFIEDGGAGAVLAGAWPLPNCPPDPANVVDTVWVYSPSVSVYLFRVPPGTADWERFIMASGERAAPS